MVPAEFRWHHAKHIGPVAQLQGYGHGEPAGTQPGVGTPPERQGHHFLLMLLHVKILGMFLPRDQIIRAQKP